MIYWPFVRRPHRSSSLDLWSLKWNSSLHSLGRSERLLGARPVRWPLRDQVSASSSSASVPMVPGTRTPAAVVSLTPMCRLLLPGFSSSRWAKSASFGSAEATVAHRRPPSPPASPACPPSPPRVGGTPQVRAPVCRAPGPLSLYHLASAQPISPPPMSLWGKGYFSAKKPCLPVSGPSSSQGIYSSPLATPQRPVETNSRRRSSLVPTCRFCVFCANTA